MIARQREVWIDRVCAVILGLSLAEVAILSWLRRRR